MSNLMKTSDAPTELSNPPVVPTELQGSAVAERETPTKSNQTTQQVVNVLHLINGEHFSGAERVQQLLGKNLGSFGIQSDFACVKPGKFRQFCELEESRIHDFPMSSRLDFSILRGLKKLVSERNIDLLHAHTPRTAVVASALSSLTCRPWVYHVHSPAGRDSTKSLNNRVNHWLERFSLRNCSHLITVSKSLRRELLQQGWKRQRVTAVHNGVAAMEPIDPTTRINQKTWRIGLVALMRPRKGIEVALAAMEEIKSKGLPIELDLIGSFETESYEKEILGMIQDWGLQSVVHCRGFTRDLPKAIRELDALILPSLFGEGLPMVVLEAMSIGIPAIASRVEGTPEALRDGVEGLLVEPANPNDLADKMIALCEDRVRWQQMAAAALRRHRSRFTDVEMSRRVAKVYRKVVVRSANQRETSISSPSASNPSQKRCEIQQSGKDQL